MQPPATIAADSPASVGVSVPAVQPADDPIAALIESLPLVPTEVASTPVAAPTKEPAPEPPAQVANLPSPAEGATDAKLTAEIATPKASAPKAKRKAVAKPRKKKVAVRRVARTVQPTANTGFPISTTPITTSTTRTSRQGDWLFNRN
jgi:hypothetical protein